VSTCHLPRAAGPGSAFFMWTCRAVTTSTFSINHAWQCAATIYMQARNTPEFRFVDCWCASCCCWCSRNHLQCSMLLLQAHSSVLGSVMASSLWLARTLAAVLLQPSHLCVGDLQAILLYCLNNDLRRAAVLWAVLLR
jgi:hypothetical protein